MDKKQIEKLVAEKIDAAFKANDTPKKFFVTENGRGVVDGGDLYNAVLAETLNIMKIALVDIISEINSKSEKTEKATEKVEKAEKSAAKTAKK